MNSTKQKRSHDSRQSGTHKPKHAVDSGQLAQQEITRIREAVLLKAIAPTAGVNVTNLNRLIEEHAATSFVACVHSVDSDSHAWHLYAMHFPGFAEPIACLGGVCLYSDRLLRLASLEEATEFLQYHGHTGLIHVLTCPVILPD